MPHFSPKFGLLFLLYKNKISYQNKKQHSFAQFMQRFGNWTNFLWRRLKWFQYILENILTIGRDLFRGKLASGQLVSNRLAAFVLKGYYSNIIVVLFLISLVWMVYICILDIPCLKNIVYWILFSRLQLDRILRSAIRSRAYMFVCNLSTGITYTLPCIMCSNTLCVCVRLYK